MLKIATRLVGSLRKCVCIFGPMESKTSLFLGMGGCILHYLFKYLFLEQLQCILTISLKQFCLKMQNCIKKKKKKKKGKKM